MYRTASKTCFVWTGSSGIAAAGRTTRILCHLQGKFSRSSYRQRSKVLPFSSSAPSKDSSGNHPLSQPLPAVAYAYFEDDYEEGEDVTRESSCHSFSTTLIQRDRQDSHVNREILVGDVKFPRRIFTRATRDATSRNSFGTSPFHNHAIYNTSFHAVTPGGDGGTITFTDSKPFISSTDATGPSTIHNGSNPQAGSISYRKAGGGGGGTGRHRCPKCGATVTFRCDFEENTFYCASCSGWFFANPETIQARAAGGGNIGDGSSYEEFLAKNGPKKTSTPGTEPEILMQHVSIMPAAGAEEVNGV
jgi:hypothetical protein